MVRNRRFSNFLTGLAVVLSLTVVLACQAVPGSTEAHYIAQAAMRISLKGNWTLTALLETNAETDNPDAAVHSGKKTLTVSLDTMKDGSRQTTYRVSETSLGLRVIYPRDPTQPLQLIDLSDESVIQNQADPFLSSTFSYEDITLHFLGWKTQELAGEETVKDRACWHIVSHPGAGDSTAYSRVESWIDKQYATLLKAVAYDASGNVVKEFSVRSFQQIENAWMPKTLESKSPALKARSRLEILDAKKH